MKINHKILGLLNLLQVIFLLWWISFYNFTSILAHFSYRTATSLIILLVLIISLIINAILSYQSFRNIIKISEKLHLILTGITFSWFLLAFLGYFIASDKLMPIITLSATLVFFFIVRKFSLKIAMFVTVITFLVGVLTVLSYFEEDYCWTKSSAVDSTGSKMMKAQEEDLKWDKTLKVGESEIGVAWSAHMRCHYYFDLSKALKEKYH